jgi:ABC-type branched-subunit amino acid transport system substrate-binding protein
MAGFGAATAAWLAVVAALPFVGDPVESGDRAGSGERIDAEDAAALEEVEGGREPTASVEVPRRERSASDRGVTQDAIEIVVMGVAPDFLSDAGASYDGRPLDEISAPFVDEINAEGGINGRRLDVRYVEFDPTNADSIQAGCIEATEDNRPFAVVTGGFGLYGDGEVCVADHETPLLTGNNSSDHTLYERDAGWVRQTTMSKDRVLRNWVDWLLEAGLLDADTRLGLVYTDVPEDRPLVEDVMLPYLEERGVTDVEVAVSSLDSIDGLMANVQRAATRFQRSQVDLVLPVQGLLQFSLFLDAAEAIGYRPAYAASDFGGASGDGTFFYPPEQWEGVTGITSQLTGAATLDGVPDTPAAQECAEVWTGAGLTFTPDADDPDLPNKQEVDLMLAMCQQLALFTDVARRAGDDPTRESFLEAFDDTGTWTHRVTLTPSLTFEPDKYDGADEYAVVRWQSECRPDEGCYRRVEPFRRGDS